MLAVIGSVTTASRFARLIQKELSADATVVQTPASIKKGGCSYSVRLGEEYADKVIKLASDYGINVRKYYSETVSEGKRVYRVIS